MNRRNQTTRRGSLAVTSLLAGALAVTAPGIASAETFINEAQPCLGQPGEAPFADRADIGEVHLANVDCVFEAEIFQGSTQDGETVLLPKADVSRGQMATIMVRALQHAGYTLPTNVPDAFDDDNGTAHEANINIAAAAGVAMGVGDRAFNPSGTISRAQQASFMVRTAEIAFGSDFAPVTGNPYTDVAPTNPHLDAIITATDVLGLTSGKGDGTYAPNSSTSREQMASFVTRLVDLVLLDASSPASDPNSGPTTSQGGAANIG